VCVYEFVAVDVFVFEFVMKWLLMSHRPPVCVCVYIYTYMLDVCVYEFVTKLLLMSSRLPVFVCEREFVASVSV